MLLRNMTAITADVEARAVIEVITSGILYKMRKFYKIHKNVIAVAAVLKERQEKETSKYGERKLYSRQVNRTVTGETTSNQAVLCKGTV